MTRTTHSSASFIQLFILTLLLIFCVIVAIAIRDKSFLTLFTDPSSLNPERLNYFGNTSIPAGLRIGGSWIETFFSSVSVRFAHWVDLLPDRNSPDLLSITVKEQIILLLSMFIARIVIFLPVLVAAWNSYKNIFLRASFIILIFMSVFGWARSNPLFSEQFTLLYDFSAVGFLMLFYFLLSNNLVRGFVPCALALIMGQLMFENLGIIVGVSAFVFSWSMAEGSRLSGFKAAFRRLIALAGVSVGTLILLVLVFNLLASPDAAKSQLSFTSYFKESFNTYGRINIQEAYDLYENTLQLLAYPIAGGLILALLSGFVFKQPEKPLVRIRAEFWASFGIWIGFWVTLVPAFFLSGLYYEMGRQLIPLACLTTILVAKSLEYAIVKNQRKSISA